MKTGYLHLSRELIISHQKTDSSICRSSRFSRASFWLFFSRNSLILGEMSMTSVRAGQAGSDDKIRTAAKASIMFELSSDRERGRPFKLGARQEIEVFSLSFGEWRFWETFVTAWVQISRIGPLSACRCADQWPSGWAAERVRAVFVCCSVRYFLLNGVNETSERDSLWLL